MNLLALLAVRFNHNPASPWYQRLLVEIVVLAIVSLGLTALSWVIYLCRSDPAAPPPAGKPGGPGR